MNDELNRHILPKNCKELIPPIINREVVPCLSAAHAKRDACYSGFQNQLSRGLAGLAKGINSIIEGGLEIPPLIKEKVLPSLTDAGRIFANLFCETTQTRRELIFPLLSRLVKEVVEKTTPGEYLFGQDLAENIKDAKNLERATKDLRATQNALTKFSLSKKGGGGNTLNYQYPNKENFAHSSGRQARSFNSNNLNQRRPLRQRREAKPKKGQSPSRKRSYKRRY